MKKLFLFVAILFASASFAKNVKLEKTEIKNEKTEVVLSQEQQDLIRLWCFKTVTYWYQGTQYDPMTHSTYEVYQEITTITCY